MARIRRVSAGDGEESIEVHQHETGGFILQKYVLLYDDEEEVEYETRSLPNPEGLFGDVELAVIEARRLLRLE